MKISYDACMTFYGENICLEIALISFPPKFKVKDNWGNQAKIQIAAEEIRCVFDDI